MGRAGRVKVGTFEGFEVASCGVEIWMKSLNGRFAQVMLVTLTLFLSGCAGRRARYAELDEGLELKLPFLAGPAAVLLTNAGNFSAKAEFDLPVSNRVKNISGQLLARDGEFIFLPGESKRLSTSSGFIWNANDYTGYAVNEPLQGYAPITSNARVTNITISASAGAVERIGGHESVPAEASLGLSDGSALALKIWRASDLKGLPLRISTGGPLSGTSVTFTDVKLETTPRELFQPPDGFTKYASVLGMRDELLRRSNVLRRHGPTGTPEFHDAAKEFEDQRRGRY